jgi:hypothetical protein
VTVRSKAQVCGRSLAGIVGFETSRGHGCSCLVFAVCCVRSGLCDKRITRSDVSYRLCVCVCVCVCVCKCM